MYKVIVYKFIFINLTYDNYIKNDFKVDDLHCNSFGSCGSCSLYEESYEKQLEDKVVLVKELLASYFGDNFEILSSQESHYRARAEFRVWHDEGACCYAMGNLTKNGFVNISECPKVAEPIDSRQWRLLEKINDSKILSAKLFGVEFLSTSRDEVLVTMLYHRKLDDEWKETAKKLEHKLDINIIGRSRKQKVVVSSEYITEELKIDNTIYKYRYYESGFTQPNTMVNIKMIEWVISHIDRDNSRDLLESYCGLGNFTIPLSKLFTKVLATEISKSSIRSAKENCELNSIENIEFVRLSSSEMTSALNREREFRRLENIDLDSYDFSCVLVDPPRAGLDKETRDLIVDIDTIIYISCNPETLARDLEILTLTHRVEHGAIFDQFPYTKHIECGVILVNNL